MEQNLQGKVALVTGAGRGIGKAIALELAGHGATVIVNYNGSKAAAEKVAEEIRSMGGQAVCCGCNVADAAACEQMVQDLLAQFGKVDILVNNAGITKDNLILRMTEEEFDRVLDVNLKGTYHTIRHLAKNFLKNKGGKIINISSVSGVLGNAGQANYAASKAGIIGLTKSIARELGSRNVCVNAIAPGFIDTDMTAALSESSREALEERIPMKRLGRVAEVAALAAFLASDKADYITGQVICVDGGMAM